MESLKDIYFKIWPYYDGTIDPTYKEQQASSAAINKEPEWINKYKQAASDFASNLIPLGNNWIEAVNNNVKELGAPIQFPPSIIFNKAKRETYKDGLQQFLIYVRKTIITAGITTEPLMVELLEPLTCYLLGLESFNNMDITTGLSRDEAEQKCKKMKEQGLNYVCFLTDVFPEKFTAFGYNAQINSKSTNTPSANKDIVKPKNKYSKILDNKARVIGYLDGAVEKGLAVKDGAKYELTIRAELACYLIEDIALATENYDVDYNDILQILWHRFEPLIANYNAEQLRNAKKNRQKRPNYSKSYRPKGYDKILSLFDEKTIEIISERRYK